MQGPRSQCSAIVYDFIQAKRYEKGGLLEAGVCPGCAQDMVLQFGLFLVGSETCE